MALMRPTTRRASASLTFVDRTCCVLHDAGAALNTVTHQRSIGHDANEFMQSKLAMLRRRKGRLTHSRSKIEDGRETVAGHFSFQFHKEYICCLKSIGQKKPAMPSIVALTAGGIVPDVSEEELAVRWPPADAKALAIMREQLHDLLASRPANAVTSDRRMMRFIKRFGAENVDLAAESYRCFLEWRVENKVDAIHDRIINERLDPSTVPHGRRVMELLPQIPCHFEYVDRLGNPVSIEYYGFHPGSCPPVHARITLVGSHSSVLGMGLGWRL